MKQSLLFGLFLFVSLHGMGQANPNNFQKMVDFLPPAPNAAAIIKHSAIDLNKNTGSPSINIPLFNVKGNKLSAGVSIGYSSTGLKVDEIASRVGMGWALNAGGVVTRTIRGWADEKTARLTPYFAASGSNCATYSFLYNVATSSNLTGGYDAEPDLFNFSMNGNAGTFVLDSTLNTAILIPSGKEKIQKNFSVNAPWNFKITTTDGIIYYFGGDTATEKTKRNNICGKTFDQYLPNAWYLTKIEHPNGEVINLAYTPLTYTYESGVSETQHWADMNNYCTIPADPSSTCINLVSTQGVLLSSISSLNSTVNFSYYASRLDCGDKLVSSITQSIGGQPSGIFNFTYEEKQANMSYARVSSPGQQWTPYLTVLKESSPDLVFNKTHKFVYNDPGGRSCRFSFSQDHWGYFNGRNNVTFIPKPTDAAFLQRFPSATANREPDGDFATKGILTKIIYPTGGIDKIDYESNDVEVFLPSYSTYHEYNCSVTGISTSSNNHVENSRSTTFTIDKAQIVGLTITCTTQNLANYDNVHMQGEVTVSGNGGNVLSESFQAGGPGIVYIRNLNPTWNLQPGTYTLTYKAKGAAQTTTVKLKFYPQTFTTTNKNVVTGGIRVKRISTSVPDQTPIIKRYYYADINQLDVSSLMQVPTPQYRKDYDKTNPPAYNYLCHYSAMYSNSINNLFNYGSGAISYNTVIESNGENFEGGAVESKFYAGSDLSASLWWGQEISGAPLSNWSSPLNGKLREEIIFKKPISGALFPIKKTVFDYTPLEERNHIKLYGYTINQRYVAVGGTPPPTLPCANNGSSTTNPNNPGDDPTNVYDAMRYDIDSYWCHVTSQTETLYDETGANPVTSTTNLFYDNAQHTQLTRSETINSKNETIKTTNAYPQDFTGIAIYDQMAAANIITPVITSKTKNGTTELTFSKVNYTNAASNNFVPASLQQSVKGNALETEGTFDLYDTKGNLLQYSTKAGMVKAIIWGYNNLYPVAEVTGTTYANAIAQLTAGSVAALQTMDGVTLQTELNKIRTNIPTARVTTYTYKPMAGVSSITDANNKTNTYDYDSFNRLLTIKDQDGNFVKKNEYVYATPSTSAEPTVFFSQALTLYFNCQTCISGYQAATVAYNIPFGKYFSLINQADANAKAAADTGGQEYANKNGQCISTITCNGPQYKALNCGCELGSKVCDSTTNNGNGSYTITYHYHWSDNSNGPPITETITCSGVDKKMINCNCETGSRVCDAIPINNGGGSYTLSYHYHWSDNSNSGNITETITCSGPDKKIINCACVTASKVCVSSQVVTNCLTGGWENTFYYRWPDGSTSLPVMYTECSQIPCMQLQDVDLVSDVLFDN